MTEETDNLVLKHLVAIRRELGEVKDDIRALTRLSFRFEQDISLLRADNLTIVERLERIERRLELVD